MTEHNEGVARLRELDRAAFVVRDVDEWSRQHGQPLFDDRTIAALEPAALRHAALEAFRAAAIEEEPHA